MSKTIETVLLNAIDDTITLNDFSNEALKDTQQLTYIGKFEWAYKKYLIETLNGHDYSIKEWVQGMALNNLPIWDDEIRELGFNSSTYWDDLAKTLIKVITN